MIADDIIAALRKVGIPRAKFQLAQLVGRQDNLEFADILRHMVHRGQIVVVKGPPPKRYALPSEQTVVYTVPRGVFMDARGAAGPYAVAAPIADAHRGYRWYTYAKRLA